MDELKPQHPGLLVGADPFGRAVVNPRPPTPEELGQILMLGAGALGMRARPRGGRKGSKEEGSSGMRAMPNAMARSPGTSTLMRAASMWSEAARKLRAGDSAGAQAMHGLATREVFKTFGSKRASGMDPELAKMFPATGKSLEADIRNFEAAARRAKNLAEKGYE